MLGTNSVIVLLIIGLIAGWLAGKVMGGGFGLIGDIVIGVVGAFIGGWVWATLHLPILGPWWLTAIVSAVVGACILLFILRLIKRQRRRQIYASRDENGLTHFPFLAGSGLTIASHEVCCAGQTGL